MKGEACHQHRDIAVARVGPGLLDPDRLERHIELLCGQHRQGGVHALAHLAARHRHDHAAIRADLDPAIQRDITALLQQQARRTKTRTRRQHRPADQQRTGAAGHAEQQRPAPHACCMVDIGTGNALRSPAAR